ncbi:MAG: hypothetical protein KC425_02920 [Anaerolineales bacterium]|nr:hypothetical protein [Anaerolineales bacterium]
MTAANLAAPRRLPVQIWLQIGWTAVLVGYLTVWLPGPSAGLQFLGVEIGEWIKFAGVRGSRNLFYLPPITLGLMLALSTAGWPARWQTWALRGVAFGVSLLAFPALEAILREPRSEWLLRLLLIGLVGLAAVGSRWLRPYPRAVWLLLALLGLAGAALPTWRYLTLRPFLAELFGTAVGIGPGVWLNGLGHLLVTAVAAQQLGKTKRR